MDSYVNSNIPTTAFGTKPETRTGGSGQENRMLIQFPTNGFPGAVTKATLYFYCKGNNQASAGNAPQNLYLPSTSWINSVTWNTQPAASLVSAVPGTPAAGQWVPIDITSPLSGWLTGNANNGVELRSTGGTNQENAFASLESSIAAERPYLVIEYAPTTGLGVGLIEEFGGTSLNSAVWSGSASVAGGIASISSEIRAKDSFQIGNATRIELRMRRISSPHVWAGIREISPGTASIDFGDNPYAGGMALAVHGPFGENAIHNSTPTAEWQEYRVTVSGDTAVLSRGSTLNNLTETLTQTLQTTASGRNMTFSVNPYGTAEIDWVKIYEPFSIEGVIVYPGGRPGKVSLVSGASSYIATSLGNYKMQVFNGPQQVSAFLDENDNGNREPWEPVGKYVGPALNITGPTTGIDITLGFPADTDNDGMSDEWELANGLNPSVHDAQGDLDGDGLANITEYRLQTQVGHPDSDGDGLSDGLEIAAGTNPLFADADGDGMDDSWETTYGLNPLIYDAVGDLDLDGLTNKEEYDLRATGYRPNAWNSKTGTSGDYRSLKGEGWTRRGYDKLDRLISTEKDTGFAQLYRYDGNSSKTKDLVLTSLDADGDTLPDAWEFTNGLAYTGALGSSSENSAFGDPDLDGYTNMQEWKAGTDPRDASSRPNTGAVPVASPVVASAGFIPTNWVMATGQLDGSGADEVVVGADGAIGNATNSISILSNTQGIWTEKITSTGINSITSLLIAQPSGSNQPSILVGFRPTLGDSNIGEYVRNGQQWIKTLSVIRNVPNPTLVQVVNYTPTHGIITSADDVSAPSNNVSSQDSISGTWSLPLGLSSNSGAQRLASSVGPLYARWLQNGTIELGGPFPNYSLSSAAANWIRKESGSTYFLTSPSNWAGAEQQASQKGAHLSTVNDVSESNWLTNNLPSGSYWFGLVPSNDYSSGPGSYNQWADGSTSSFRNWGGAGSFVGATTAAVISIVPKTSSFWGINFQNAFGAMQGIGEIPPFISGNKIIPSPFGGQTLVWKGKSMTSGRLRDLPTKQLTLLVAAIEDSDSSGNVTPGDDFSVAEFDVAESPITRGIVKTRLDVTSPFAAYGLTSLKRMDATKPSIVAIGEPDGTVSLWTAPDATSPLVRKVFTTEFQGKAWHQLEVFHEANGTEGLVGLLVDPATPAQCQLIHWSPESIEAALNGTAPVLNNVPSSRILPAPSQGGAIGSVAVRIWDAEAHGSSLELQYQRDGEITWSNATVTSVDGASFQTTLKLTSQPSGISHSLAWNAAANLGSAFSGTVLLRTRATDSQTGEWSPAMPYAVNTSINLDTDGDGMPDAWEASHGLVSSNPADGTSDSDRDGITAFLEYALAMNPTVSDVSLLPILGTKTEADGKHLTLTYRRPINSGLTYTAERSVTLAPGNWQFGTTVFQELTPLNLGDGTESVTVEDLNPMAASSRAWLRLRVSK